MVPVWKKWLSHLTPITIEEAASEQNPELAVVLDRGRLQLLSGNSIYSWDDLYHNFTKAFDVIQPEKRAIEDVLLLGLGLGSIPLILEKMHHVRYHYTAVEWDETIAELAERYTLSRLSSSIEVVTADAGIFVEVCEDQYDLLIVDIFEDNITPALFETTDFLENCQQLLRPGGLLLYNRLFQTTFDQVATERFYQHTFQCVFPNAYYIETGGNWILCAENPGTGDLIA